jgi:hypothetical protein
LLVLFLKSPNNNHLVVAVMYAVDV